MKIIIAFLIVSVSIANSFSQNKNWNLAIGGNQERNGLSENLGPDSSSPTLLWSGGEAADVSAAPIIEDDKLILHRRLPSNSDYESWITCYNLYTGAELWKINLPNNPGDDSYGKVSGVNDGVVYATRAWGFDFPAKLIALDINNGDVLWQSANNVTEYPTETVNFNSEGDIIAGNSDKILCIDKTDGTTKWEIARDDAWAFDGTSVCIHNDKAYYWRMAASTDEVTIGVCNVLTGEYLYSSPVVSTGVPQTQQNSLMLGSDGTVYATRCQDDPTIDYITSFTDDGSELIQNWQKPIGLVAYGNHGVGPDSSIYTFSRSRKMVRLDYATGDVVDSTSITFGDATLAVLPCIAIGADGIIYMTINDYPNNKLFVYTPSLELIFSESISGIDGVALGEEALAIAGEGTEIRVYQGRTLADINQHSFDKNNKIEIYPNPTTGQFTIKGEGIQKIEIVDITGKTIKQTTTNKTLQVIDLKEFPKGIYFAKITTIDGLNIKKLILH